VISLEARTDLTAAAVLARARAFFVDQRGMQVEHASWNGISFRGASGGVSLVVSDRDGALTTVDMVSREYDALVLEFARSIRPAPAPVRWLRKLLRRGLASSRDLPVIPPPDDPPGE